MRGARPRKEDRRTIEAIIWRLGNGAKWRPIPAELGDWHHTYLRFRRWTVKGGWDKIMQHVVAGVEPKLTFACIDGTVARVHQKGLRRAAEQTDTPRLRFNRSNGGEGQARGRFRRGLGCKIVGVCYAYSGLVVLVLVPGQAHKLAPSLQLLAQLPKAPVWALADMACDATEFRAAAEAMGAVPVVPSRRNAKEEKPCPGFIYRHRNLIERCGSRLKERRRSPPVTTRRRHRMRQGSLSPQRSTGLNLRAEWYSNANRS